MLFQPKYNQKKIRMQLNTRKNNIDVQTRQTTTELREHTQTDDDNYQHATTTSTF